MLDEEHVAAEVQRRDQNAESRRDMRPRRPRLVADVDGHVQPIRRQKPSGDTERRGERDRRRHDQRDASTRSDGTIAARRSPPRPSRAAAKRRSSIRYRCGRARDRRAPASRARRSAAARRPRSRTQRTPAPGATISDGQPGRGADPRRARRGCRSTSATVANDARWPAARARARRFARYSGRPASLATLISQPVVIASARIPKSSPEQPRGRNRDGQRDKLAETVGDGLVGDQRKRASAAERSRRRSAITVAPEAYESRKRFHRW